MWRYKGRGRGRALACGVSDFPIPLDVEAEAGKEVDGLHIHQFGESDIMNLLDMSFDPYSRPTRDVDGLGRMSYISVIGVGDYILDMVVRINNYFNKEHLVLLIIHTMGPSSTADPIPMTIIEDVIPSFTWDFDVTSIYLLMIQVYIKFTFKYIFRFILWGLHPPWILAIDDHRGCRFNIYWGSRCDTGLCYLPSSTAVPIPTTTIVDVVLSFTEDFEIHTMRLSSTVDPSPMKTKEDVVSTFIKDP
ncbi:hypothetical protein H5410_030712 [Solanum commersonii]|uniref:Uncharacterized protein n=1 Tax=Solanum commersonii TaxID=4109 RepID=A0A9J5YK63_SOLCO|nr:hypothetical protein H5410_030712 [Solanum commersonii]